MEIAGIKIDDQVDITDKVCPLTFVKAKVALDELEDGEVIAIRMNDGEPVQNVPVLVDFYSDSCVPCKRMSPVVGDVEDEREGSLSVYKVNINFDTELAEQYDVQSVPTLLLFKGGAEVARQSGAVRKDALNAWIDDNVK